jgi:hypothetical protein
MAKIEELEASPCRVCYSPQLQDFCQAASPFEKKAFLSDF